MDGVKFKRALKEPHPQFGVLPCDLPPTQLPTRGEVIGRIMKRRLEYIHEMNISANRLGIKPIIRDVAEEVVSLWRKASVPCWGVDYTEKRMNKMWEERHKITKSRKDMSSETAKDMCKLFDIAHRQSIPEVQEDKTFLKDQRGRRNLHIGASVDGQTTASWRRQERRRLRAGRETSAPATSGGLAAAGASSSERRTASLARLPARRSAADSGK